jgi:hypothetical protein
MMMVLNFGISPSLMFAAKAKKTNSNKTSASQTPEQMANSLQTAIRNVFSDVRVSFRPPYPPEMPIAPDFPKGLFMVSLSVESNADSLDREPKVIQALKKIGLQEFDDNRYNPPVSYKFNDIHVVFAMRHQYH